MRNVLLLLLVSALACAQPPADPAKMRTFNITVNYEDYTVKTQMLKDPKDIKIDNELSYLWFTSNKIIETKGGYSNRLLHGPYRSFYLNDQMKEQGTVKYGLKNGEWRSWYPDGRLKEIVTYKNGRKRGPYWLYNDYGTVMAKGNFRHDRLHGKFYTYDANGKAVERKKYRHGVEVVPWSLRRKQKQKSVKSESPKVESPKAEKAPEGKKMKVRKKTMLEKKRSWKDWFRWRKKSGKKNDEEKKEVGKNDAAKKA